MPNPTDNDLRWIAENADRIIIAVKNAEAIAETLVKQGQLMAELSERVDRVSGMLGTLQAKQQNLEQLYHKSLVNKYGTGPTAQ
jgi:hypothetical protein